MAFMQHSTEASDSAKSSTVNKNTSGTMVSSTAREKFKDPERYNNITKSPNDKRDYRGLILHNKLKVLLISDPTTDKSAASLDVDVGYFCDPKELPGLAHFCEHMLFLGTTKYPEVNEYNQYLSQNGGSSNAATDANHTNFYFDVNVDKLEDALDRFSQFFIAPLFTESATEKEINAIHLEHEKNLANDTWRLDQLDKSSADPDHVYSKFGSGSKETLEIIPKQKNIDVRQKLLKFYNDYYSANIMSLSVLGKESLDELEKMVCDKFSDVENKNINVPKWTEHPFKEEHFKTKWSIVPIKDIRNLTVTFPIPDLHVHYRSSPLNYWSHLLGHESKGSLLSELKAKGWCNSLVSGSKFCGRGFDFFYIFVDLTEEGVLHVNDIIKLIFQYINMLKRERPTEWIFNECRDIEDMHFRFEEKSSPRRWVQETVLSLQKYPIEEVLSAPCLLTEWRPDLIKDLEQYLRPKKIRVHLVAKYCESIADSVEPWYGTKYKKERIPDTLIKCWKDSAYNGALKLPEQNEFIPNEFVIKPIEKAAKFPAIIVDNPFVRCWFKQDDEFFLPKATMIFDLTSPLAHIDPLSSGMVYLFTRLFQDSLNEYSYNADLAGLSWQIGNSKYGLDLIISGYDHKLDILLEKCLDRLFNFEVDEKRFDILKENYVRKLKNFETKQPYQHAGYHLAALLSERFWAKSELLNCCSMLTVDRIRQFIPLLLSKIHIECLIHGNVTHSESLKTVKLIENKMTTFVKDLIPLLPKQLVPFRELQLPNGCHYLFEIDNKHHKSSCTQVYYQTGIQSTESNMLLELFTQIISEPCFNQLRNEEQLGYIVVSGVRRNSGVQGLLIIVQSNKHPQYVEERIESFIKSMEVYIKTMPGEEFNRHKESVATKRLVKPKKMNARTIIYWSEISAQEYNFDRVNIEVAYLRTITRSQMIEFFQNFIEDNSFLKHKLSIHVMPSVEGVVLENSPAKQLEDNDSLVEEPVRISDVLAFKTSHPLHPLVKPFNNTPRRGNQQQSKL